MTPRDRALELIRLAARDQSAAQWLQTNPAIDHATIAFHYQQAAEKLLKALLAEQNVNYPLTHDVERLLTLVEDVGYRVPVPQNELIRLTPFAVNSRYEEDEEIQHFDPVLVEGLIQRLREWAEGELR